MANEKILNTRIQLKYDTLANWNASAFKLKAGELAIVTVGEMKDGSTHSNAQYPVLFKVGTGEHTFSELPFASALAADVYDWAKAAKVQLVGKEIQFQDANGTKIKGVTLNYITETEATTLINNALTAYSTTEQMNAAIKVEKDRAEGVEGGFKTRIEALETAVGENGSVATQIQTAIEGLDSTASQAAGADGLALGVTLVDGKVTSITGSIAANTYDAHGAAAAVQGNVDTLAGLVGTLPADAGVDTVVAYVQKKTEGIATDAALTELTNRVKGTEDAIAEINDGTDGILAQAKEDATAKANAAQTAAEAKVTELANGAVKANTEAIAAINKADTGILAQAKAYTDEVKAGILGEGITETYDTLVEIQNWINGAGVNATELTEAIAEETKNRENAVKGVQDQIDALSITDGKVNSAATADVANSLSESAKAEVADVKVNKATNADVAAKASGLDASGEAAVKAVKVDNAAHADTADNATNATNATNAADAAKLGGVAAADYALKTQVATDIATAKSEAIDAAATDAQNKADAVLAAAKEDSSNKDAVVAEAQKAATAAETAAKAYADSLAGGYATAAQGAKADTALQSVEAGTGLKVSTKADNKQTIDIDETVVFVFDCGSASKNID